MKFALLIHEDERQYGDDRGGEALAAIIAQHRAFAAALGPALLYGAGLKEVATATTVRCAPDGTRTLHDGPFAETKEQLGGLYVVEAPDLDAALAIARRVPLHRGGSVEVRPLIGGD